MNTQYFLGLDIGSASVKGILLDAQSTLIEEFFQIHHGKLTETVISLLQDIRQKYTQENTEIHIAITGVNGQQVAEEKYIISDIPCIQKGVSFLAPKTSSLIEIGAQNARFLTDLQNGSVPQFAVNENCAGGTGSFFEDQMYRLALPIEKYSDIVAKAESVPRLSGRCSVFAKTDIIHRQQEGTPTPDILLGLCHATIRNLKATTIKNLPVQKPLALGGGIIKNAGVLRAVREIFELQEDELIVNDKLFYVQAFGVALMAQNARECLMLTQFLEILEKGQAQNIDTIPRCKELTSNEKSFAHDPHCDAITQKTVCSLGIDTGSTSTNIVLVDENGNLVDFQYLRSQGKPKEIVKEGLLSIQERLGNLVEIKSVGVTGSGRYLIGEMVGADSIKDEITAQGTAAICVDKNVDTVFEIGGQDSKFIQIDNGEITEFQMNKVCAAGTGSFVEEQAGRMNIPLSEYGDIALKAKNPVDLGERCTVFIESNITQCLAKGAEISDILAGLCHSIIQNYTIKVVGNKHVGNNIILQGGVCYNPAIVAAFQAVYGDRVSVSPYFSISGAYGVARLALEETGEKASQFKGFDLLDKQVADVLDKNANTQNKKALKIEQNTEFYKGKLKETDNHEKKKPPLDTTKKTIGIPNVLALPKLFPLISAYFEALGFNVILSSETNEDIIAKSQEYAQVETCYPIKLIYGHMAWLAQNKVDFIFYPQFLTKKHDKNDLCQKLDCMYMQAAPRLIFKSLPFKEKGIAFINPIFAPNRGVASMLQSLVDLASSVGKSKVLGLKAMLKTMLAIKSMKSKNNTSKGKGELNQVNNTQNQGFLEQLAPHEKVLVLISRGYVIKDPALNQQIPEELLSRGYKVITSEHLRQKDLAQAKENRFQKSTSSLENYDNLYWSFGGKILSSIQEVAKHPNLYAVYLTVHGCGPDAMLSHFVAEEMGDKPYLQIEVDEHFSKVGIITRIEAFLNSIENKQTKEAKHKQNRNKVVPIPRVADLNTPLYLPYLYPYNYLLQKIRADRRYSTYCLPQTTEESLTLGRQIVSSKEYLSFTALAGDVLLQANEQKKKPEKIQILVPQTEGAEVDGMYTRVLYNYIKNNESVSLVGTMLDTLPFVSAQYQDVFFAYLAGDIVLASAFKDRETLLQEMLQAKEINLAYLVDVAKRVPENGNKKIALIGEPAILYNSYLNNGIFEELEQNNYALQYMPLSEYYCSLWGRKAQNKEEKRIVQDLVAQMQAIAHVLKGNNSFAKDFASMQNNTENDFYYSTGANAYYRKEKQNHLQNCQAFINASSMYENTQTMIDLSTKPNPIPSISLGFEGTNHTSIRQKLDSFLYYVK